MSLEKIQNDIQPWQVRRAAEYMTHAPNASINSVGGIITEPNAVNFVNLRQWLAAAQFFLGWFTFIGHLWHAGRARAVSYTHLRAHETRELVPMLEQQWGLLV